MMVGIKVSKSGMKGVLIFGTCQKGFKVSKWRDDEERREPNRGGRVRRNRGRQSERCEEQERERVRWTTSVYSRESRISHMHTHTKTQYTR